MPTSDLESLLETAVGLDDVTVSTGIGRSRPWHTVARAVWTDVRHNCGPDVQSLSDRLYGIANS